ncbi:hypothetical protein K439DRAFT_1624236 [Ramaria rubella]|nr:hypothetical protein K439DRAFT_1624236 [Ramaria rubella]
MSSQGELATLIRDQSDFVAVTYVIVAAFGKLHSTYAHLWTLTTTQALIAYDTFLTFPSEVRFIWHKKFRLGTILYLLARYPTLGVSTFDLSANFSIQTHTHNRTCNSVLYFTQALDFLPLIGAQSLLFARAYVISSHNKLVFMILALLDTIAIVLFMIAIPNENCTSSSSNLFTLYVIKFLPDDIHSSNTETEFMIHVSVRTLNGVFTILFDTAVFVATLGNILELLQLHSESPRLQRNTLSKLLVQQGILRYGFVLTISIADAVTLKALRMSVISTIFMATTLSKLANPSRNYQLFPKFVCAFLSVIIICRFHLDLQQINDHPNGSTTSHSLPLGSFHAVKERIHRAIVDEFGDLSFNESFGMEVSQEGIELQTIQSPSGVAEIDLQDFPWAGGDIGDEEAGPVASGSGILRE